MRGNAGPGARTSESAALRKPTPPRSVPVTLACSAPKPVVFATLRVEHRPLSESDPLRARRPAPLGRCGSRCRIHLRLWDACEFWADLCINTGGLECRRNALDFIPDRLVMNPLFTAAKLVGVVVFAAD